jgi:hypothetical protein
MRRHLATVSTIALLVVGSTPSPILGQDYVDDESSLGVSDLFTYSDEGAEIRDSVDSTLSSATGLNQRGIVFAADITQFYQGSNGMGIELFGCSHATSSCQ